MTPQKAPFTLPWIVSEAVESVRAPRRSAETILGFGLPVPVLMPALLLVVIVSVIIREFVLIAIPAPEGQPGIFLLDPFTTTAMQLAMLTAMAAAVHLIGRAMGGAGSFAGALAVVTWLQVVLVCVQIVQTAALLVVPPVGLLIGWAAFVLFLWMLTNFVAVLHGFASLGLVFVMILMSSLGIVFVFSLLLAILGVAPSGGFDV